MLNRLKGILGLEAEDSGSDTPKEADALHVAAAVLLVEAARMDEAFDPEERAHIKDVLGRRFSLDAEEADTLLDEAERQSAEAIELATFVRHINDRFALEQKIELMQMLWEVAYADGELHAHEAMLARRVAGLIHVPDKDSGIARQRARAAMGVQED